jgi:hypothetical protein
MKKPVWQRAGALFHGDLFLKKKEFQAKKTASSARRVVQNILGARFYFSQYAFFWKPQIGEQFASTDYFGLRRLACPDE